MTYYASNIDRYVIDGVTFRGRPSEYGPLPAGAFLLPDGVKRWRGGVTVRAEDVPRISADGSFATPGSLSARTSEWKALVLAHNDNELGEWEDIITGIGVGRLFPATGQALGRVLSSTARAAETPTFDRRRGRVGGMVAAETAFQLVHPDPFLYAEEITAGPAASVPIEARGVAESWPTLTVRNAGGAYTVTGGGATFTMTTPLPGGAVDVIESASMTVRRNGVLVESGFSGWVAPIPKRGLVSYTASAGTVEVLTRPRLL
ncbi:MAG: hypothetical protein LBE05_05705 [Microbacterium sp.]|jgi:hypothetical protein|nr:hypothetical protein [Microbacterium sp.]